MVTVDPEYGFPRVKRKCFGGQVVSAAPEHEDLAEAVKGEEGGLADRRGIYPKNLLKFGKCTVR